MVNSIGWFIVMTFLSALCYHLGGIGKPYPTKLRDIGCSLITLQSMLILHLLCKSALVNIIVYLLCFGLSWGALSTYWKKKGTDAKWWNWFLHGFFVGLAAIPCMFLGVKLYIIIIRAVILGLAMMVWSEKIDDVTWEESGRGALIILTLPIILI
jgi:hypothetical protein